MSTSSTLGMPLVKGMKELFKAGLYSDVTIKCDGTEFRVHKAVLHTQSKYFATLFSGGFQESKENKAVFELDADSNAFGALIHYCYHFVFDDSKAAHNPSPLPLEVFSVQVYQLADEYDIPPLRELAADRFKKACNPKQNPKSFVDALYAINENTSAHDKTLLNIAIPISKANMNVLLNDRSSGCKEALKEMEELNFLLLSQLDLSGTTYDNEEKEEVVEEGNRESSVKYGYFNFHYQYGSGRTIG